MITRIKYMMSRAVTASVVVVTALAAGSANAALPAAISTELATVQADGLAMADLVWPVVIALFGALVLFKLFKRFGSKI
ncbi:major coat protein [Zobellella aerophila]|uniref:Phage coat protein n=1 Tax=Zobellella aerophila TaxID=870480 RepID=A0ABP6WLF5_9GAMM